MKRGKPRKKKAPPSPVTKCAAGKAEKLAEGVYVFRVSDEGKDCESERILSSAWGELAAVYPVLKDHDREQRIGQTRKVWLNGSGALMAEIEITDAEARKEIDTGVRSAASVGFHRLASEQLADGGTLTTRARLLEISVVKLGCNVSAHRTKTATPPRITKETIIASVRQQAKQTYRAAALSSILQHSGCLDEVGLKERCSESPALARNVAAAFAAVDVVAAKVSESVAESLTGRTAP